MLVKIEQKYLENPTYNVRGHSIVKFALRREEVSVKYEHTQTEEGEIMSLRIFASRINFFK